MANSDLKKKVSNYKTRLKAAGVNTKDVTDSRNLIEKALNLKEGQNALFDILEVINRPQNALLTGVDKALNGESFVEGLGEGITGETNTTGKDLLVNHAGMEDREGKLDLSDVLGFGIDIVSDPLDYLNAPTSVVSKLGKVGAEAAETAAKAGKEYVTASNLLGQTVKTGAKGTAKVADNVLESTLKGGAKDAYEGIKSSVKKSIDSAQNLKGLMKTSREAKEVSSEVSDEIKKDIAKFGTKINDVSQEVGADSKQVQHALSTLIEKDYDWDITGEELIDELKANGKKYTDVFTKETADKVINELDKYGINIDVEPITTNAAGEISTDYRRIRLKNSSDSKKLNAISDKIKDTVFGKRLSNEDYTDIKEAQELLNSNPKLKELYNEALTKPELYSQFSDRLTGMNSSEIAARRGYVTHTENKELQGQKIPGLDSSANKQFNKRKYNMTINEANRQFAASNEKKLAANEAAQDAARRAIYATDEEGNLLTDEAGNYIREDNLYESQKAKKEASIQQKKDEKKVQEELLKAKNGEPVDESLFEETRKGADGKPINSYKTKAKREYAEIRKTEAYQETLKIYKGFKPDSSANALVPEGNEIVKKLANDINEIDIEKISDDNLGVVSELSDAAKTYKKAISDLKKHVTKRTREINAKTTKKIGDTTLEQTARGKLRQLSSETSNELADISHDTLKALKNRNRTLDPYEVKKIETGLKDVTTKLRGRTQAGVKSNTSLLTRTENSISKITSTNKKLSKEEGVKLGLIDYEKETQALRQQADDAYKVLQEKIKTAKIYANDTGRKAIKQSKDSFTNGKRVGDVIANTKSKLKVNLARKEKIFEAASDLSDKLGKQIELEQASLDKFIGSQDKIFKEQSKRLENLMKAHNNLSSLEGKDFMETSFTETLVEYANRNARFTRGAKVFNDSLMTGLLSDKDYVKFAEDIPEGSKVPYGFIKLEGNKVIEELSQFKDILPESTKEQGLSNVIKSFKGKPIYVDKQLARCLSIGNVSNTDIHPMLKVLDGINNTFKKFSTLTPGFQVRNIVGNMTNMVLSGVDPTKMPQYYKQAANILNNSDTLLNKFMNNTLTEAEAKDFEIFQEFKQAGFADAFKKEFDLEEIAEEAEKKSDNALNKLINANNKLNEKVDGYNRLALLLYAKENPNYVAKLGFNNAIDAVKFTLFDPQNMSEDELNVMKRIIPFYTFTKQNLMFQADNILKNTSKYSKLYKAIRDSYDDLGTTDGYDNYYDYQRNNMQIPLPFTNDDGSQMFLKLNLPVSDLGEFMSNPLQKTVSSATSVIKTPFEAVTGVSTYTGQELNNTAIKDLATSLGINLPSNVTDKTAVAEQILNGLGLQNVSTNLIKKVTAIINNAKGDTTSNELLAEIFRSVLQNDKTESIVNSGLYNDYNTYQAYIQTLKNQGIDVPTISEMTASNKIKLNNLKNKRASSK